jgi:hypothetical protein
MGEGLRFDEAEAESVRFVHVCFPLIRLTVRLPANEREGPPDFEDVYCTRLSVLRRRTLFPLERWRSLLSARVSGARRRAHSVYPRASNLPELTATIS